MTIDDIPGRANCRAAAPRRPRPAGGPAEILLDNVTHWYGNVVAVNDITMTIGPGVTGLLGPNGAGKSTLLHLVSGFLAPSRGAVTVAGQPAWRNPGIYKVIGLVPERDSVYAFLTGRQFVAATAKLHKLPDAGGRRGPRAAHGRDGHRGRRPPHRHLLQGHAPAHQGRRGARARAARCCCSTSRSTAWTRASACT